MSPTLTIDHPFKLHKYQRESVTNSDNTYIWESILYEILDLNLL